MLQWNGYEPAAGATKVAVLPGSIVTLNPPALSAVTVCRTPASFFTVTVDPAFTGVVWNVKFESIVICAVPESDGDVELLLLLPQAARPRVSADRAMRITSRRCTPVVRHKWSARFNSSPGAARACARR